MKKKKIYIICFFVTAILILVGIGIAVCVEYHKSVADKTIKINDRTNVELAVKEEVPGTLPVYEVSSADNLTYIWNNILCYCGFSENIEFKHNAQFSNTRWEVYILDTGEIRVWSNKKYSDEKDILSNSEMHERAKELMEQLGLQPENYCISGQIYGDGHGLTYNYLLEDYRCDMYPDAFSVCFEGYELSDFSVFLTDFEKVGYTKIQPLESIPIYDVPFYSYAEEIRHRYVENLKIIKTEIVYELKNGMLLPHYDMEAEINYGGITTYSAFGYVQAGSDIFADKKTTLENDVDPDSSGRSINEISDFFNAGKSAFNERDFQRASKILYDVYYEINNLTEVNPELLWIKHKSLLYAVLADLCLDKTSEILSPLLRCDEYFEIVSYENHDWLDKTEYQTARVFTKVALAYRYTELHEYEMAGTYLVSAKKLIDEIPGNKYQELFYRYVMTMLSPHEAEDLVKCIDEWREMCYGGVSKNFKYYAPIMKVMAAKSYCKSGEFEKADALFGEFLQQGIWYGNNEIEEMRLKTEIFTAYAEFLTSNETDTDDGDALQYLLDVTALYNSLRMIHNDGVIIDGPYFKQSGTSYYKLAVYHANHGQVETALTCLDISLIYLEQFFNESREILIDALQLGVKLCESTGNTEKAQEFYGKLNLYNEKLPVSSQTASDVTPLEANASILESFASSMAIVKEDKANIAKLPIDITKLCITRNGEANPKLVQAVESLNCQIDSILDEYMTALTMNYLHCVSYGHLTMHELRTNLSVVRADDEIISILLEVSWYTNGPHEILNHHAMNYSLSEDRIITEEEIFKSEIGSLEDINSQLHQKYSETIIFDVRSGSDNNYEVLLTHEGVYFVFSPGRAGAYVDGTLTLLYPYANTSKYKK